MQIQTEILSQEALRATELLKGKVVASVFRHRPAEVLVEFTDGSRLFVDIAQNALELSIQGGQSS